MKKEITNRLQESNSLQNVIYKEFYLLINLFIIS